VGNETLTAIIDCGASVDYVNGAWCKEKGFEVSDLGEGWMEGYDGHQTKVQLRETEIELDFEGLTQKHEFRVIEQTGTDIMVLGMPWLQKINPNVDWKNRKVTLRKKKAKKNKRKSKTTPSSQNKMVREIEDPKNIEKGRGGYQGIKEEEEYQERLKETQAKLPKELKEYAEVFCQRK
jgi:aspartyl protease